MTSNINKKDNTLVSLHYYDILKDFNNNYLYYIKKYNSISKEFHQKLLDLQKDIYNKMNQIINKIDKNLINYFSQIINFIKVIPNIFDLYIENLNYLIKSLDLEIISHKNFLEEKEKLISKFKSQIDEAQNYLNQMAKNIDDTTSSSDFLLRQFNQLLINVFTVFNYCI